MKKNGGKQYLKEKGFDNLFNNRIDKKDIIMKNELLSRTR